MAATIPQLFKCSKDLLQLPYSRQFKSPWVPMVAQQSNDTAHQTSCNVAPQTHMLMPGLASAWGCESR